jgi:hypothetical protein
MCRGLVLALLHRLVLLVLGVLWVHCNFAAGVDVFSERSEDAKQRIIQPKLRAVGGADLGHPFCKNVSGTTAKLFDDAVSVTGCKRRMAGLNWKESRPVRKHSRSPVINRAHWMN